MAFNISIDLDRSDYMYKTLKQELAIYVEKLKTVYEEHLKEVVLYGKCAKIDYYDGDHDIEIMILVDMDDAQIREYQAQLSEVTYEMFLEGAFYITPIVFNKFHFMDWKDSNKFYKKIDSEGVRLYKDDTSIVEKYEEHREKRIVVAAYQFEVSDDINENYDNICKALIMAKMEGNVQLIVFGECALSGYLGMDIESVEDIDYENLEFCLENLGKLAYEYNMHILLGTITKHKETFYNSAVLLTTDRKRIYYAKRDLTRNEIDEIKPGEDLIIFAINGVKIGVRIGKELATPEYFRELKDKNTDLNIVLSYGKENINDMTKVYTRCRACENSTYMLNVSSVNDIKAIETAETCLVSDEGDVLVELDVDKEDMFIYEINIV